MVCGFRPYRLDGVTRGDLVTVALQGEQGKPRPALVVQADLYAELTSVTILPVTSTLLSASLLRVDVEPTVQNGLTRRSQIMVDKIQTPPRARIGAVIGHLDTITMLAVSRALGLFLELGVPPVGLTSGP